MHFRQYVLYGLLGLVAICLVKMAFFPSAADGPGIIPRAHAEGGIIEWKDAMRIVTTGDNGATTYVWDYESKTKVRKYSIQKGKLTLEIFALDN